MLDSNSDLLCERISHAHQYLVIEIEKMPTPKGESSPLAPKFTFLKKLMAQLDALNNMMAPCLPHEFKSMVLARMMGQHIRQEWALVEEPHLSISRYLQRVDDAKQQFQHAQRNGVTFFAQYQQQAFESLAGFKMTMKSLINGLSEGFALEEDKRLFKTLMPYLPWHQVLIHLAITLFGEEKIKVKPGEGLIIQEELIDDCLDAYKERNTSNLLRERDAYRALLETTQDELASLEAELSREQKVTQGSESALASHLRPSKHSHPTASTYQFLAQARRSIDDRPEKEPGLSWGKM